MVPIWGSSTPNVNNSLMFYVHNNIIGSCDKNIIGSCDKNVSHHASRETTSYSTMLWKNQRLFSSTPSGQNASSQVHTSWKYVVNLSPSKQRDGGSSLLWRREVRRTIYLIGRRRWKKSAMRCRRSSSRSACTCGRPWSSRGFCGVWDAADGAVDDSPAGGDLVDDMCEEEEIIYEVDS